jgi:tripartite-type tricarboxylate transporter receptor subunit TctC
MLGMVRLLAIRLTVGSAAVLFAGAALAQTFPTKPIRLVVAFPPGGATDVIARIVAQPLSLRLGQPVVVENRPGSNGNIAADIVSRTAPDGHTLLLGSDSYFGINPHLYPKMSLDPMKAFVPIATLVSNQLVLAINPTLVPVNDIKGFVDFAGRAKPELNYASIGNGSQHHLGMEMFKQAAGIKLTHVPYKGGGPAGNAVIAGEVAAMLGGGSVVPLAKSGKMRALGVTGGKRSSALPDLPTIGEIYPGYEVNIWQGLFAPTGTPPAVLEKLRNEVNAVLELPEVGGRLVPAGAGEPYITSLDEFKALIRRDYDKYGKVIRETGLTVD